MNHHQHRERHGGRRRGPGMNGGGFGPGGGRRRRRGDVRLAVLLLIAERPSNGYQLIQEIGTRSDGRWKPSSGAIYPALAQLEDEGLIQLTESEAGKIYQITDAGRTEAETAGEQPAPWETNSQDGERPHLMAGLKQLHGAVTAVAQSGDEDLVAKAAEELDQTRRRLFKLLADG